MRQRLEARLALEPEIARHAATRCDNADLELMRNHVESAFRHWSPRPES